MLSGVLPCSVINKFKSYANTLPASKTRNKDNILSEECIATFCMHFYLYFSCYDGDVSIRSYSDDVMNKPIILVLILTKGSYCT